MRKLILYLILFLLPVVNNARITTMNPGEVSAGDIYAALKLADTGLVRTAFDLAVKGLEKLYAEGKLKNANLLTIADYSQSSKKKRLYVIDLKNKKLLF